MFLCKMIALAKVYCSNSATTKHWLSFATTTNLILTFEIKVIIGHRIIYSLQLNSMFKKLKMNEKKCIG